MPVSLKDFLTNFVTEDINGACTSQPRDFGHQKNLLWLLWVKTSAGAFGSKNLPRKSPVKSDSPKHITNCTCMLSKALGLVFAWCIPTSSVVSCGENPRTHLRFPTKNLAQTRRAGEFVLSSPGKWTLHFRATACSLCFDRFIFVEVSAATFYSGDIFLPCKGSSWNWVPHQTWGWMRAEESTLDFMHAPCSTASKEHFELEGMQPCLIKVLFLGLLMELAWLYHLCHCGPGEETIEGSWP